MLRISSVIIAAVSVMSLAGQEAQTAQKTWKDRTEYDLYSVAAKETDPQKKIESLNAWKEKYPATNYQQERLGLYLGAYQQLKDIHKMVGTLNEMLTLDPKELQVMKAIMVFILSPQFNDLSPATLANMEKVANQALANLESKPAAVTEADWPKTKSELQALSHTGLGWAAMNRKDNDAAARELIEALKIDPTSTQLDVWLGNVLRAQKTPEKVSQSLFYYARAAAYDGPGALPPPSRQQIDDYLRKAYNSYHGQDDAALAELKALAKTQAFPAEGFMVETAAQIAARKEEEFRSKNPQLALWMSLKKELTGANGQQYFESSMKGAEVPAFKATVISAKPALRPKELVVGIADAKVPEATLKLDTPLAGKVEPGTEIEFAGIAETFAADPFMVTFAVEREKVKGLKITAGPVVKKTK